jgi:hypothetical protein
MSLKLEATANAIADAIDTAYYMQAELGIGWGYRSRRPGQSYDSSLALYGLIEQIHCEEEAHY